MDIFSIAAAKKLAGSGGGAGSAGENGGYYTPSISEDGILTWTPSKSNMPSISGSDLSSIGNIEFVTCNVSASLNLSNFSHTFAEIEKAILNGKFIRLKGRLADGTIMFGEIVSYNSSLIEFALFAKFNLYSQLKWHVGTMQLTSSNQLNLNFEQLFTNIDMVNYYTKDEIDEKIDAINE